MVARSSSTILVAGVIKLGFGGIDWIWEKMSLNDGSSSWASESGSSIGVIGKASSSSFSTSASSGRSDLQAYSNRRFKSVKFKCRTFPVNLFICWLLGCAVRVVDSGGKVCEYNRIRGIYSRYRFVPTKHKSWLVHIFAQQNLAIHDTLTPILIINRDVYVVLPYKPHYEDRNKV